MDFFERQEQAHRRTTWLVALFAVAVVGIVLAVMAIIWVAGIRFQGSGAQLGALEWARLHWNVLATAGVTTLAVIGIGSLGKTVSLGSDGDGIARALGGRLLEGGDDDLHTQRLLNVVEEMAIAAGLPCPRVYLLDDETGINAFAAGFTPENAAIGITRGAIDELDRDELQGVIAHEFSHILNGDMRLNLRLIGVLHGILLISLIGRRLIQSLGRSGRRRRSDGKGNGQLAVVAIGAALIAIGGIGLLVARWIKATVSRQREFLADASAVQFTRNPHGIGGALVTLLRLAKGSQLDCATEEASHLLFGAGARSWLNAFATHPPLEERIRAIDPNLLRELPSEASTDSETGRLARANPTGQRRAPVTPDGIASFAGEIRPEQVELAGDRLREFPADLRAELRSPESAAARCLGLLLAHDAERSTSLAIIERNLGSETRRNSEHAAEDFMALAPEARLPLVELAFPALRRLPDQRRARLLETAREMADADANLLAFEWSLLAILDTGLDDTRPGRRAERAHLDRRRGSAVQLVGLVIDASGARGAQAVSAFTAALAELGWIAERPGATDNYRALADSLRQLRDLRPADKRRLLRAVSAAFLSDRHASSEELELLRAVGIALRCPIPVLAQRTS